MPDDRGILTADDLASLVHPPADARLAYGTDPCQFGDLRLPVGSGPHPVVILLHGGCWKAEYDLTYVGAMAAGLATEGIATWTLEYRRVGHAGGGWPGTFIDVARGADHLRTIAAPYALDVGRVVSVGHSAGGQLAIWLAARHRLVPGSALHSADPLVLRGVLALAPAAHLAILHADGTCEDAVDGLLGGSPATVPERYRDTSPPELVPIGVPQIVLVGRHDTTWRPNAEAYYEVAREVRDPVEWRTAPDSGHFELVFPSSSTWPIVVQSVRDLLNRSPFAGGRSTPDAAGH